MLLRRVLLRRVLLRRVLELWVLALWVLALWVMGELRELGQELEQLRLSGQVLSLAAPVGLPALLQLPVLQLGPPRSLPL